MELHEVKAPQEAIHKADLIVTTEGEVLKSRWAGIVKDVLVVDAKEHHVINRSAITGRFVSDEEVAANPETTTREGG